MYVWIFESPITTKIYFMDTEKELDDYYRFLNEYLFRINDIELLILKGHNLVENAMNRYIQDLAVRPEEFYKQNLTFAEKLGIMKFLTVIHLNIFERLTLLNKVRNQLSHNLNPDMVLVDKLLVQFSYQYDLVKQNKDSNRVLALRYGLRNTCVELNFGRIGAKIANFVSAQKK